MASVCKIQTRNSEWNTDPGTPKTRFSLFKTVFVYNVHSLEIAIISNQISLVLSSIRPKGLSDPRAVITPLLYSFELDPGRIWAVY